MAWIRGVVGVSAPLTANTCYRLRTGRCSLELIGDFSLRADVTLPENDLLFCPRLRKLAADGTMPLPVFPCDCGHVKAAGNSQLACVAARSNLTLTVLSQGEQILTVCPACADQKNELWNVKALVKR